MTNLCPFLTDAQVEDLDAFGMIDLDDAILDSMMRWAFGDDAETDTLVGD